MAQVGREGCFKFIRVFNFYLKKIPEYRFIMEFTFEPDNCSKMHQNTIGMSNYVVRQ